MQPPDLPDDASTSWVLHLELPDRPLRVPDVYDHVYGAFLDEGAKPWPWFRDPQQGVWWSMGTPVDRPLDRLAWLVPLDQLQYCDEPRGFLQRVVDELERRSAAVGGTLRPECDLDAALEKQARVLARLAIERARVVALITQRDRSPIQIADWRRALEGAGLRLGDGDLFWLDLPGGGELCAEPWTRPGYFHPADQRTTFPDVALHTRVRELERPEEALRALARAAARVAEELGAVVVTEQGRAWLPDHQLARVETLRAKLAT